MEEGGAKVDISKETAEETPRYLGGGGGGVGRGGRGRGGAGGGEASTARRYRSSGWRSRGRLWRQHEVEP